MKRRAKYRIKEPNLIGKLGEDIAEYILEILFPSFHYWIFDSNPLNAWLERRADFEIHRYDVPDKDIFQLLPLPPSIIKIIPKKEVILVEVKTTIHKDFHISGSGNRKYFQKEIELYRRYKDVTKILVLRISLGHFPEIYYSINEIQKDDKS